MMTIPLSTQLPVSPIHAPLRTTPVCIFPPKPSLTLCNQTLLPKRLGPPSGAVTASHHATTSLLPTTGPATASHLQVPEHRPISLVPGADLPALYPPCPAPPARPAQPRTQRPSAQLMFRHRSRLGSVATRPPSRTVSAITLLPTRTPLTTSSTSLLPARQTRISRRNLTRSVRRGRTRGV